MTRSAWRRVGVGAFAAFVCATAALADPVAFDRPETAAPSTIEVRVPSAKADGVLPHDFSGYGKNHSPAVEWSGAPVETRSFAMFVEDPDVKDAAPVIHWVAWNIAPNVTSLPRALRNESELKKPPGMRQAQNSHGGIGWTGPHPPVGDAAHHYHVQIFALDRRLGLRGGVEPEAVIRALRGHVLARGETVILYAEAAPKPAPAAAIASKP